ncbi:hypothetical protein KUD11_09705 [Roseovarius sp. LXJ103]|uniref:hypothetical protein n=1 Tax=Roseovarius carneus TaxID=2853164 RepID=UPI0015E80B8D|nr:hypothetical protein [Roseovarius carneus]MBZ8118923.1 hypothetical protein [Roseovarius carneus]
MSGGLVQIARAGSSLEASLTIAALEGAGFSPSAPGFHTVHTLPYLSTALGGIPIRVPAHEAPEALAFLRALPSHTSAVPTVRPGPAGWLKRALLSVAYLLTGRAPHNHSAPLQKPPKDPDA